MFFLGLFSSLLHGRVSFLDAEQDHWALLSQHLHLRGILGI